MAKPAQISEDEARKMGILDTLLKADAHLAMAGAAGGGAAAGGAAIPAAAATARRESSDRDRRRPATDLR